MLVVKRRASGTYLAVTEAKSRRSCSADGNDNCYDAQAHAEADHELGGIEANPEDEDTNGWKEERRHSPTKSPTPPQVENKADRIVATRPEPTYVFPPASLPFPSAGSSNALKRVKHLKCWRIETENGLFCFSSNLLALPASWSSDPKRKKRLQLKSFNIHCIHAPPLEEPTEGKG